MSARLELAAGAGAIDADMSVFVVNPPLDIDLGRFADPLVVTDMMPDAAIWQKRRFVTSRDVPDGKFDCGVLFLPRSKHAARDLLARMSGHCARLLVDGARTDGIGSVLKDVKARTGITGTISKAHGKLFWFEGGVDFSDWRADHTKLEDRWIVQPGVFSADSVDPGSAMLAAHLPQLSGRIADLGAGWGYLAGEVLGHSPEAKELHLVEAQGKALDCARQNVTDPRAVFHWADALSWKADTEFDAVIMNPPFHSGRKAEPDLGRAFISRAAAILRRSGVLWMVANRHLPYEATLDAHFRDVEKVGGNTRFKILRATGLSRAGR